MSRRITRRGLAAGSLSLGGLMLAGCDRLGQAPAFRRFLGSAEGLNYSAQRTLQAFGPLAREYREKDLSPVFKANGTMAPSDPDYVRLLQGGFSDWRLTVDGLVDRPMDLSLDELQRLPARTQITRHDCVEGWSAIGKWTGAQLGPILNAAGVRPNARFAVFHCADTLEPLADGTGRYYESVDLIDAFHPQTILAYRLNDQPLEVAHGAPLRLRVERQLGYKQAKYLMRIEMVESFNAIGRGRGGYWPDRGYEWYAGI
jgi:DMSO/TMAO reductase YedYZ molybdopterin-dependent catalytic subunit